MNKICVYTCITGNYDDLKEIKNMEGNIDYYCFTNNKNIKSKTWKIIYIDEDLPNLLLARKIKVLGSPLINDKYDIVLWMDAAVEFIKPINDFINNYYSKKDKFVCFKHGLRNSIKDEMDSCLRFRKEKVDNIEKLKDFYKKEKYNYDNGLIESTVLIKNPKDKKVIETMNLWFDMISNYTRRDQLSFNYCIFKTGLEVKWINEYVFDNDWFSWFDHSKEKFPENYMIYYGNIDEYDNRKQIENNYKIKNQDYIIEEKVKFDTNEIYVELSNVPIIKYNLKIQEDIKVEYQNTIDYRGVKIFFKYPGFVILKGNFKKNEKLNLIINFEKVEDYEKNKIIDFYVSKYYKEVLELEYKLNDSRSAYNELKSSYDSILNSSSWKITKPLRFITKKIKK